MRDTPETDAVVEEMSKWQIVFTVIKNNETTYESPIVYHARKLEWERDEARKEALYYKTRYELLKDGMNVFAAKE